MAQMIVCGQRVAIQVILLLGIKDGRSGGVDRAELRYSARSKARNDSDEPKQGFWLLEKNRMIPREPKTRLDLRFGRLSPSSCKQACQSVPHPACRGVFSR